MTVKIIILCVLYILGFMVYYAEYYKSKRGKSISELEFVEFCEDGFVIIFWLPMFLFEIVSSIIIIAITLMSILLGHVLYFPFKLFSKIFYRDKKKRS